MKPKSLEHSADDLVYDTEVLDYSAEAPAVDNRPCFEKLGAAAVCLSCPLLRVLGDCPQAIRQQAEVLKGTTGGVPATPESNLLADEFLVPPPLFESESLDYTDLALTFGPKITNSPLITFDLPAGAKKQQQKSRPELPVGVVAKPVPVTEQKKAYYRQLLFDDSVPIVSVWQSAPVVAETARATDAIETPGIARAPKTVETVGIARVAKTTKVVKAVKAVEITKVKEVPKTAEIAKATKTDKTTEIPSVPKAANAPKTAAIINAAAIKTTKATKSVAEVTKAPELVKALEPPKVAAEIKKTPEMPATTALARKTILVEERVKRPDARPAKRPVTQSAEPLTVQLNDRLIKRPVIKQPLDIAPLLFNRHPEPPDLAPLPKSYDVIKKLDPKPSPAAVVIDQNYGQALQSAARPTPISDGKLKLTELATAEPPLDAKPVETEPSPRTIYANQLGSTALRLSIFRTTVGLAAKLTATPDYAPVTASAVELTAELATQPAPMLVEEAVGVNSVINQNSSLPPKQPLTPEYLTQDLGNLPLAVTSTINLKKFRQRLGRLSLSSWAWLITSGFYRVTI